MTELTRFGLNLSVVIISMGVSLKSPLIKQAGVIVGVPETFGG